MHDPAHAVDSRRARLLWKVAVCLVVVLFAKNLIAIVYEYRWYFPANFEASDFLMGRQSHFRGLYRTAFYLHIVSGPIAIVLALVLMFSGGRAHYRRTHRWIGRGLGLLVVMVVTPSGLVMATEAFTGPIAGWGFASLSVATAGTMVVAVYNARARRFKKHQVWATRCFILLCSPLLLRMMTGTTIVLEFESEWTYRGSAWISWIAPLAVFEAWRWRKRGHNRRTASKIR